MKKLICVLLCFTVLSAHAAQCLPARTGNGSIIYDRTVIQRFRDVTPCPATGETGKFCQGYVAVPITPLACCGEEIISNYQYLPVHEGIAELKRQASQKQIGQMCQGASPFASF